MIHGWPPFCECREERTVRMSSKGATIRRNPACLLALILFALPLLAPAQQDATEDRVKAAYLFNFAKLAEWPASTLPDGPSTMIIGVKGADEDFLAALKTVVAGKTIGTHVLVVRSVSSAEEMKSCAIVFFRASEKKSAQASIEALTHGILLVGEDDNFLRQGGMINLVRDHGTVRFEINPEALDRSEIHFSSKIMALAKVGSGSPPTSASNAPVETGQRRLEHSSPPEYPALAEKMKLAGTVQVQAVVKPDGTVRDVTILGGHPLLADALVRAVKQWKYQPAPRETLEVVKYNFSPQ